VEAELGESPRRREDRITAMLRRTVSPLVIEAFVLTFIAEWGDRSQITTISLAASQNAVGVTLGGCIGHIACTGAAVLGGKQLAAVIQPRTVNIIGGLLFLLFGAATLYEGPEHAAR
jgi:putative Ca2+/H+ antiporter (TMEM165/GDT1 family)